MGWQLVLIRTKVSKIARSATRLLPQQELERRAWQCARSAGIVSILKLERVVSRQIVLELPSPKQITTLGISVLRAVIVLTGHSRLQDVLEERRDSHLLCLQQ